MVESDKDLYDIAIMRQYIEAVSPFNPPQILDVQSGTTRAGFRFLHVSREECRCNPGEARRSLQQHAHDVYHIVMYTAGKNRCLVGGAAHKVRPGTLVLSGPGLTHNFYPCDAGDVDYVEITFEMVCSPSRAAFSFPELLSLYSGLEIETEHIFAQLNKRQQKSVISSHTLLMKYLNSDSPAKWLSAFQVMSGIFSLIINEVFLPQIESEQEDYSPLSLVHQEIELHFQECLTIDRLAKIASLSPFHLIRTFKKEFGLTPMAYQLDLRIKAAENLLQNTNFLCKEIAARVGFSDVYHFSRIFKRETGLSPSQFRKNHAFG